MQTSTPKPTASLADQAYEQLLERLLDGRLVPGDMLNRRLIAKELNMSVAPILEAMLRLEGEQFLQTLPRKGTRVRPIRKEELRDQLIFREAIECQAARLYCGAPVKSQLKALQRLARAVDESFGSDPNSWLAEVRFHRELIQLAKCPPLLNAFDQVMRIGHFFIINRFFAIPKNSRPKNNHLKLLRQLGTKDADMAEKAMRDHLVHGRESLF